MITNNNITYYHKGFNSIDRIEKWEKYSFENVWEFGVQGSITNKGYDNSNVVDIRIPMEYVEDKSIFAIGDLVVIGESGEIEVQSDLEGKEYYNIVGVTVNDFGNNPHIHLRGN